MRPSHYGSHDPNKIMSNSRLASSESLQETKISETNAGKHTNIGFSSMTASDTFAGAQIIAWEERVRKETDSVVAQLVEVIFELRPEGPLPGVSILELANILTNLEGYTRMSASLETSFRMCIASYNRLLEYYQLFTNKKSFQETYETRKR